MEKTMNDFVLKNLIAKYVEKNSFNRLGCLSVVKIPRLMDFYYGKQELTIEELARIYETLEHEHRNGV